MQYEILNTIFYFLFFILYSNAQSIPVGISNETIKVYGHVGAYVERILWYYKPVNYDTINGSIWWAIHGIGGDGKGTINELKTIADRRNILIVAPNAWHMPWANGYDAAIDSSCTPKREDFFWLTHGFKQMYRHILLRENRDSIAVYLSGFSAGGQTVTRYILIRQIYPDSIPIRMAVSMNPYSYTFCTDTLNGIEMRYPCGIGLRKWLGTVDCKYEVHAITPNPCKAHILQYYNENYAVLIGTVDTSFAYDPDCVKEQGNNRYERAKNFYNFSDTNAVTRGTTLKWQYAEVPGVAHDGYAMYHTKAKPTDTSTIAETLLFDTPWHPVPNFLPQAKFSHADTALTVSFTDSSTNTTAWLWDFGDTSASPVQNPVHTYSKEGTYYVCLTVGDSCVSDTYCDSVNVIATGEKKFGVAGLEFTVYPNPSNGQFTLTIHNQQLIINNSQLIISNLLGQTVYQQTLNTKQETLNPELSKGMYFIQIENEGILLGSGKLMVQ